MLIKRETSSDAAWTVQCWKCSRSQWVDNSTDAEQWWKTLVRSLPQSCPRNKHVSSAYRSWCWMTYGRIHQHKNMRQNGTNSDKPIRGLFSCSSESEGRTSGSTPVTTSASSASAATATVSTSAAVTAVVWTLFADPATDSCLDTLSSDCWDRFFLPWRPWQLFWSSSIPESPTKQPVKWMMQQTRIKLC